MSIVEKITLPANPTADEMKQAAAQARENAEHMRAKAVMWDNLAASLERSATRRAIANAIEDHFPGEG